MSHRPTYREHTHWHHYQPFFPEGARVTEQNAPREEWWSWQGCEVHLDRYVCPDARLKVLLLHGAGAHGRLMGPFGVILRDQGYAAVAPDLPGYGLTQTSAEEVDYERWIEKVCALLDAELERDGLPIVLFGVSLGGMLAYQIACHRPQIRGLIATTLADPSDPNTRDQLARGVLLARLGSVFLPRLRPVLDPVRLPIRWLSKMNAISNQPEMVALLLADKRAAGSHVPLRLMRTLMGSSPPISPEDFDACPVLLVHPEQDRMTPLALSDAFLERIGAPTRRRILEGAGHMPLEEPGISQLRREALGFLETCVASLPAHGERLQEVYGDHL